VENLEGMFENYLILAEWLREMFEMFDLIVYSLLDSERRQVDF
jgi:hypothetical protein